MSTAETAAESATPPVNTGEPSTSVEPSLPQRSAARVVAGWVLRIAAGVPLGFAAFAKSTEPAGFQAEVAGILPLPHAGIMAVAAFVLMAEVSLSLGLMLGWQVRSTAWTAAGLYVVFLGVLIAKWIAEGPVSCTCFGDWWIRSPRIALISDVVFLLAAAGAALAAGRGLPEPPRWKSLAVAGAAFLALGGGYAQMVFTVPPEELRPGEDVREWGLPELRKGDHLLVVIDTTCERCRTQWPNIARLVEARDPSLPPRTVAITNPEGMGDLFRADFNLAADKYPLPTLPPAARRRFLMTRPPVVMFVRNGQVVRFWKGFLPEDPRRYAEVLAEWK